MINHISALLGDKLTAYRHIPGDMGDERVLIYKNIVCGLARSAFTHSPTPLGASDIYAEKHYKLRLYTLPDILLELGDAVEVKRHGQVFCGTVSDSFAYDTHRLCVLMVKEVQSDTNN